MSPRGTALPRSRTLKAGGSSSPSRSSLPQGRPTARGESPTGAAFQVPPRRGSGSGAGRNGRSFSPGPLPGAYTGPRTSFKKSFIACQERWSASALYAAPLDGSFPASGWVNEWTAPE